jgi:hypothetical protein
VSMDVPLHVGSNDTIGDSVKRLLVKRGGGKGGSVAIWRWLPQGLLISLCGLSLDTPLHSGYNDTNGDHVQLGYPEILQIWFGVVLAASGALIRLSLVAHLQGGSNDTIGGHIQLPT